MRSVRWVLERVQSIWGRVAALLGVAGLAIAVITWFTNGHPVSVRWLITGLALLVVASWTELVVLHRQAREGGDGSERPGSDAWLLLHSPPRRDESKPWHNTYGGAVIYGHVLWTDGTPGQIRSDEVAAVTGTGDGFWASYEPPGGQAKLVIQPAQGTTPLAPPRRVERMKEPFKPQRPLD